MTEDTIFRAARGKEDPTERAAYLDAACAGNPALRQRVEALLDSRVAPARQAEDGSGPTRSVGPEGRGAARPAPADDALASLAPGREPGSLGRLDHYEVLEVVGRGGMGVVFKAHDTKLQRIVAIKVLAPLLVASATARQRFVREAQAFAAVRDDHVVSIHAVNDEGPVPYLVMEFIAGVTLADRVERGGPLGVEEIVRIGVQATKGLAAAHARGLIHRDVKPGNILLEDGGGRVKLTDFGLARAGDEVHLTQSGAIAGTPLYMSPEQARGEPLDPRSDLFSLGSVLYLLCTGRPAFPADNTLAVLKRVCDDVPRPIRDLNPDIPEWLAAVVGKLLAKDPADRFPSAADLAEALAPCPAHFQKTSPAEPRLEPRAPEARKRRRFAAAVLLGLAAIAAAVLTVVALSPAWLFPPRENRPGPDKDPRPAPEEPRVLTVSKNPQDGGRFRTIREALDSVEPGMTIRLLDDAVYEEHLQIDRPEQYRGVVLEAVGKATLRPGLDRNTGVRILGVPGFTLRRLRFESSAAQYSQVSISRSCAGVVLDQLTMTGEKGNACIQVFDVTLSAKDAPILIQNCTLRGSSGGVLIEGLNRNDLDRPVPSGHVVIRNNTLVGIGQAIDVRGAIFRTHVVGNRILDSGYTALDLMDLLPGTADVLVANNTLLHNQLALRLWDDSTKGKEFLKCKNMRIQNNLVLEPQRDNDMAFIDHRRGARDKVIAGDVPALLKSPGWRFSHNWREMDPPRADTPNFAFWIPGCPHDRLLAPIAAGSRAPTAPDFLRPPRGSPLGSAGAGADDKALPSYVGAFPPEGEESWDWDRTWQALAR